MKLDRIQIRQFRNLTDIDIRPASRLNLLLGSNGSGKSSLLEAIHYLGFGRSFRSNKHQHVIQHECDAFTVFCQVATEIRSGLLNIGYQRFRNGDSLIKVDGEPQKRISDLVRLLPIQLFTPASVEVISGSPGLRRKFLDWGLFHVEPSYLELSLRYQQVLKQRNALIRQGNLSREGHYWNEILATAGEQIDRLRKVFVEALEPYILRNLSYFLPEFCPEISYHSGWDSSLTLEQALHESKQKDQKYGFTSVGPHKADLRFRIKSVAAQELLSRGQARMLMAALLLAQSQHFQDTRSRGCVFLLDDIGAELDEDKRQAFIEALLNTSAQLFVTAIEKRQIDFVDNYTDKKVFHVEHGQVKEE